MRVLWTDQQDKVTMPFLEEVVDRVCSALAARFNVSPQLELSIAFVDNTEVALLNNQYRGKSGPTDVLSFGMADELTSEVDSTSTVMLGDVIISAEMAEHQAKAYGHSLEREVAFLLTHGILHLLGYEHDDDDDVGEMGEIGEEILAGIGLSR